MTEIGYEALWLPCLREAIARDYARRGCPTRPEQIIVTSGTQNGLNLVPRASTGPGDRVALDHPTYHNALGAILRNSCRPIPIGLPKTGWDLDAINAAGKRAGHGGAPRDAARAPRPADRAARRCAAALAHARARRGLSLWAELPRPEASAPAAMAQGLGLRVVPGPRFAVDGGFERFMRLPFTLPEADLQRAVERLARGDARLRRSPAAHAGSAWRAVEAERII